MSDSAPDVAGVCLTCRTIFLVAHEPTGDGIEGGTAPVGWCPSCEGLVVAVDAASAHLTELVEALRRSGSLHFATLLSLVESWEVAPPEPLAALAELSAVAPEVLEILRLPGTPIKVRMAAGTLLRTTLRPLLDVAAGHGDAARGAEAVLDAVVSGRVPSPL